MEQQYIDIYKKYSDTIKKHSSPVINALRDQSFDLFCKLGFPTTSLEDFKYTDLRKPLSFDYGLNINRVNFPVDTEHAFKCNVPGISSYVYFVVNDAFYPNNKAQQLPDGVLIGSLKEMSEKYPEIIKPYFGQLSTKKQDGLIAFNGAFAQDGFFMYVPDGVQLDRPVQLINVMRSNADFMANSHNLIILGKGAKAQLLVCDHTVDDVQFMSNRVTEVFAAEGAIYEHYKLENSHNKTTNMSALLIDQQATSNVLVNVITLNNGVTRNNIEIALNGEYTETILCGMVTSDKVQSVDNHTSILHNKPNCHSTELFKYILDEQALCAFTGGIYVARDAQKTIAYQNSKTILLDKTARIRTKPQLEIYADDVKCSHGATIGQLDETALFYLQSRGIPKSEARLLLMYAFAADVIDYVHIEALRDRIKMMVENRLRTGESKGGNCALCN